MTDEEKPKGIASYVERLKSFSPGPAGGLTVSAGSVGDTNKPAGNSAASVAAAGLTVNPFNVTNTSQPGISKVAGTGLSSPLFTNIGDTGQAVAGLGQIGKPKLTPSTQKTGGPESGITITPFGGVDAASQQAPQRGGPESGLDASYFGGSGRQAAPNEGLDRFARANAITQELIDRQPRGGSAALPDQNAAWNARMERSRQIEDVASLMARNPQVSQGIAAAFGAQAGNVNEETRQKGIAAGISTQRRGQDLGYGAQMAQMGLTARGQDMQAATVREQIGGQERVAEIQANAAKHLTLPQVRENQEIEAARQRLAGMSADEIKRRTANYTETGRENPDFDPTLARAQTLAGRRMYGDDRDFDARRQQPADDAPSRFKADKAMAGHKLGKQTERGTEVFDANGRLIGHYR